MGGVLARLHWLLLLLLVRPSVLGGVVLALVLAQVLLLPR